MKAKRNHRRHDNGMYYNILDEILGQKKDIG